MSGVGTPRIQESLCNQKPGKVLTNSGKYLESIKYRVIQIKIWPDEWRLARPLGVWGLVGMGGLGGFQIRVVISGVFVKIRQQIRKHGKTRFYGV